MTLKHHSEYGFRIIIYLLVYPDRVVPTREIAEKYDISVNHLNKVSQLLVRIGCVDSVRGKGGGIKLSEKALSMRLGDLLEHLEPTVELAQCGGSGSFGACLISPACKLKGILAGAQMAFKKHLNQFLIADLKGGKENDLRKLFEQAR